MSLVSEAIALWMSRFILTFKTDGIDVNYSKQGYKYWHSYYIPENGYSISLQNELKTILLNLELLPLQQL